ncbi:MAG: ADP-forming succinate--CoA ligase subunit beta [Deltaproteobacteria bacterium]|nr:ADP-forming succinate--CoA ligase subunit beta [Deltaproteobacteria bacterium]MBW2065183.1 ADP-forming succinate--CoA ligase subunit beta [Deltaproteobacteria bacterium]
MKLYEYQAKEIFRGAGIPVPESYLISDIRESVSRTSPLALPVMAKAQVLAGKRGKAGFIRKIEDEDSLRQLSKDWHGKHLNGEPIKSVLLEETLPIEREVYLSISVDAAAASPVIVASSEGGMNVEELAAEKPDTIIKKNVNIFRGLQPFEIRNIVTGMGLSDAQGKACAKIVSALYSLFRAYDAEIAEINPLVIDRAGKLWAADAKMSIDDAALYRHKEFSKGSNQFGDELEYEAYQGGLSYVRLDGNIGVICTGAGLTMTTLDLIKLNGGRPANFLDFGGANYKNAANALRIVLRNPDVKALLLVTFGLFARADTIAEGVVQAVKELKPKVPIIMAVRGTGEETARQMIEEIGIETFNETEGAVKKIIQIMEA